MFSTRLGLNCFCEKNVSSITLLTGELSVDYISKICFWLLNPDFCLPKLMGSRKLCMLFLDNTCCSVG